MAAGQPCLPTWVTRAIIDRFGLGLVVYLWFANLLGRVLHPTLTFVLAAVLVLLLGLAFAWKGSGQSWIGEIGKSGNGYWWIGSGWLFERFAMVWRFR